MKSLIRLDCALQTTGRKQIVPFSASLVTVRKRAGLKVMAGGPAFEAWVKGRLAVILCS